MEMIGILVLDIVKIGQGHQKEVIEKGQDHGQRVEIIGQGQIGPGQETGTEKGRGQETGTGEGHGQEIEIGGQDPDQEKDQGQETEEDLKKDEDQGHVTEIGQVALVLDL